MSLLPLLELLLDGLAAGCDDESVGPAEADEWALEAFRVYGFRGRGL